MSLNKPNIEHNFTLLTGKENTEKGNDWELKIEEEFKQIVSNYLDENSKAKFNLNQQFNSLDKENINLEDNSLDLLQTHYQEIEKIKLNQRLVAKHLKKIKLQPIDLSQLKQTVYSNPTLEDYFKIVEDLNKLVCSINEDNRMKMKNEEELHIVTDYLLNEKASLKKTENLDKNIDNRLHLRYFKLESRHNCYLSASNYSVSDTESGSEYTF